eukprot:16291283-Heterocapsa_arctica.AAC.1
MGYHCHVRQEEAVRFLPQYRQRGILIVTRDDIYQQTQNMHLGLLFTRDIRGTEPTIHSTSLVGPEPPQDHCVHLTEVQIQMNSPG